jgi:hypothetical protein
MAVRPPTPIASSHELASNGFSCEVSASAVRCRRLGAGAQAVVGQHVRDGVAEGDDVAVGHGPQHLPGDREVEDRHQHRHARTRVLGHERHPQRLDVVVADDRHRARAGAQGARQLPVAGPAQVHARHATAQHLLGQLGGQAAVTDHQHRSRSHGRGR